MTVLPVFLADLARRRWRWGETDCLMVLSDWVRLMRGVDPAAPWRGTYSTEAECWSILDSAGGIEALLTRTMAVHGFSQIEVEECGAIGLVTAPTSRGRQSTGAICAGPLRWAVTTRDRGLVVAPLVPLAIWRL